MRSARRRASPPIAAGLWVTVTEPSMACPGRTRGWDRGLEAAEHGAPVPLRPGRRDMLVAVPGASGHPEAAGRGPQGPALVLARPQPLQDVVETDACRAGLGRHHCPRLRDLSGSLLNLMARRPRFLLSPRECVGD